MGRRLETDEREDTPRPGACLPGSAGRGARGFGQSRTSARTLCFAGRARDREHCCPNERVVAGPHVLQIDDETGSTPSRSTRASGRGPRSGAPYRLRTLVPVAVPRIGHANHVLRLSAVAVLGAEDHGRQDAHLRERGAAVGQIAAGHRGGVGEEGDLLPAERGEEVARHEKAGRAPSA